MNETYLIVDVRNGGIDGYYFSLDDAQRIRRYAASEVGHDDLIVVRVTGDRCPPIGDRCFLSNRIGGLSNE
ncbi:hypothetical protein NHH03_22350 [Stieleria sp. TO1_6]|uniref:hypothetical protein n=1 Tax=Stieleria tagensis TaxID=2956795 RepID=UPI00209B9742|nr:hypothetical protein [Stieleria tagensis]MCO8124497.1 hypothetical protein [Stieleria tagensis]